MTSSPIRPVNVNIMTPGCVMTPNICHVSSPMPPRPASPPPYSPPSPVYCPDPTPSPASSNMPAASGNSLGNCASGSASVTSRKTPESTVFKRKTVLTARKVPKTREVDTILWQQILNELPRETFKFC